MILSPHHPQEILYRSSEPVLRPETPDERLGTVGNVVFPTGIDRRTGPPENERFDVYYGMADRCIGVARLELPAVLPSGAPADQVRV